MHLQDNDHTMYTVMMMPHSCCSLCVIDNKNLNDGMKSGVGIFLYIYFLKSEIRKIIFKIESFYT